MGLLLISVALVEYVVLPQLAGAGEDLSLLASAEPFLLLLGLALEACSLGCFTLLTRATLPPVGTPGIWTLLRIDLTGYGISHVMPGGGATAAAFRYRLLLRAGVDGDNAFAGAAVQTATALVTLTTLFLAGMVLSVGHSVGHASYAAAGVVALVLLIIIGTSATLLTQRRTATLALVHRVVRRAGPARAQSLEDAVSGLVEQIGSLSHDRRLLGRTLAWATANWALDAACLWCCLRAYGFSAALGPLLALYCVVNLLAMLPITPGGLGILEGVLVPALVSFQADPAVALFGVLTWRLAQFWLPIPLSALTYASLRLGRLRHPAPAPAPTPR